jgi:hypothetical protein
VTRVVFGSAASQLARYARAFEASLLVVGTHGRTGLSHLLRGSTAERLLRSAHCPVLVVPPLDVHAQPVEDERKSTRLCLVCNRAAEELICEACRGHIRGEAIMSQQEDARRARVF